MIACFYILYDVVYLMTFLYFVLNRLNFIIYVDIYCAVVEKL